MGVVTRRGNMTNIKKRLSEAYQAEVEKQQQQEQAKEEQKKAQKRQKRTEVLSELRQKFPTIGGKIQDVDGRLILNIDENHFVIFSYASRFEGSTAKEFRVISSHPVIANPINSPWFSVNRLYEKEDCETALLAVIQDQIVEADKILTQKADNEIESQKRRKIESQNREIVSAKLQEIQEAIAEAAQRYTAIAHPETHKTFWQWTEGKEVVLFKYIICTGAYKEDGADDVDFDYQDFWSFVDPQTLSGEKGFVQVLSEDKQQWIDLSQPIDIERWVFKATEELPSCYGLVNTVIKHSVVPGVLVDLPITETWQTYQDEVPVTLSRIASIRATKTVLPEDAQQLKERFGDDISMGSVLESGDKNLPRFYFEEPIDPIKEALS